MARCGSVRHPRKGHKSQKSLRLVFLFVAFNVIGLGFSIVTLWISHDLAEPYEPP